ncbi:MAG: MlaC/ttg2D family ABC transporter substrate-binding protein [Gammaproteobacteria bacterium]
MLRSLFLTLFLIVIVAMPVRAQDGAAVAVVRDTSDQLLTALRAERGRLSGDRLALMSLVEQILMPALDFRLTARLALGRAARDADEVQLRRFEGLFREMLLRTYTAPLLEYADDIRIEFPPPLPPRETDRATVRTELLIGDRPAVPVNYAMRRVDGQWRVYDVVIAGISAVITLRRDFESDIRKQGLDGFMDRLESHIGALRARDATER